MGGGLGALFQLFIFKRAVVAPTAIEIPRAYPILHTPYVETPPTYACTLRRRQYRARIMCKYKHSRSPRAVTCLRTSLRGEFHREKSPLFLSLSPSLSLTLSLV